MELDDEFVCSQISVSEYNSSQSSSYGLDVVEVGDVITNQIVSLESDNIGVCSGETYEKSISRKENECVLHDNVVIEDILSDEELDKMYVYLFLVMLINYDSVNYIPSY